MSYQVAAHQTEGYRVNTALFEGPLDLLLGLIERAELDITTFALAQVTDQYLSHLRKLQQETLNAGEVSAFLVIAARLVQIKSAALLPRIVIEPTAEEEDPGEALARQLILYKRFKDLAGTLTERERLGLRTHLRVAPPAVKVEGRLDLSGLTLQDLLQAARSVFLAQPDLPALSRVVAAPRITIREKIKLIVERLRSSGAITFHAFLKHKNDRLDVVVTFLAMLELIKRKVVFAQQGTIFGEIALTPTGEWDEINEAQLEFIE